MTASNEAIRPGAAEAPARKRPQRRVGTFTLGVTLVACGGAMLSALCFPAIPPERFLQASPVILILLGLETLLSLRKDGGIKYDWMGMLLCFLLVGAALSLYAAAWYFSEDGPGLSRVTARCADDSSYAMAFENLDSSDSHILHLQSGDVLREAFTLSEGSVDVVVCDLEGNTLAENTAFPGASAWENLVEIPAGGSYWVRVDADSATGSFLIGTIAPETPDTIE